MGGTEIKDFYTIAPFPSQNMFILKDLNLYGERQVSIYTHREYPKFEIILLNTKIIERISFLADNQILDSYEKENVKISHEALLFHDTFIWKFILKLHSL